MIPFSNKCFLFYRYKIHLQLLLDWDYLLELSIYSTINASIIFGDENKKNVSVKTVYKDMFQRSADVEEFISIVFPVDEYIILLDSKIFCLLYDIDLVIISDRTYVLK
ncbi:MAG: hypothetical protein ACRD8K_00800 [Nitrososphaeraceae archaeon]